MLFPLYYGCLNVKWLSFTPESCYLFYIKVMSSRWERSCYPLDTRSYYLPSRVIRTPSLHKVMGVSFCVSGLSLHIVVLVVNGRWEALYGGQVIVLTSPLISVFIKGNNEGLYILFTSPCEVSLGSWVRGPSAQVKVAGQHYTTFTAAAPKELSSVIGDTGFFSFLFSFLRGGGKTISTQPIFSLLLRIPWRSATCT